LKVSLTYANQKRVFPSITKKKIVIIHEKKQIAPGAALAVAGELEIMPSIIEQ
jgi:hypothetical protein